MVHYRQTDKEELGKGGNGKVFSLHIDGFRVRMQQLCGREHPLSLPAEQAARCCCHRLRARFLPCSPNIDQVRMPLRLGSWNVLRGNAVVTDAISCICFLHPRACDSIRSQTTSPDFRVSANLLDDDVVSFMKELESAARVRHPAIVQIFGETHSGIFAFLWGCMCVCVCVCVCVCARA